MSEIHPLEESVARSMQKKKPLRNVGHYIERLEGKIGDIYVETYTRTPNDEPGIDISDWPRCRKEKNRRFLLHNDATDDVAQIAIYDDGSYEFTNIPRDVSWLKTLLPSLEIPQGK